MQLDAKWTTAAGCYIKKNLVSHAALILSYALFVVFDFALCIYAMSRDATHSTSRS
jgi:hypothetical protein